MRQAPRWAVFRDRRSQTVALWIEFQSEVKEKKIPWRLKVEFDPEAQGSTHFSTEGVSLLNWELCLWLWDLKSLFFCCCSISTFSLSSFLWLSYWLQSSVRTEMYSDVRQFRSYWTSYGNFLKASIWLHDHSVLSGSKDNVTLKRFNQDSCFLCFN